MILILFINLVYMKTGNYNHKNWLESYISIAYVNLNCNKFLMKPFLSIPHFFSILVIQISQRSHATFIQPLSAGQTDVGQTSIGM